MYTQKNEGILGPRGTAFYRTYVYIKPGHKMLVYFSACSFYCQLYVDGMFIGDHKAGGYQPFSFKIDQSTMETSREIFVVVDNRFNRSVFAPPRVLNVRVSNEKDGPRMARCLCADGYRCAISLCWLARFQY